MEDPDTARRRAIQAIYFDTTLTPSEKHDRIQAIQNNSNDSDSENMSIYTEGNNADILSRQGSINGSVHSGSRTPPSSKFKTPTTIAEDDNIPTRVSTANPTDVMSKASCDTDSDTEDVDDDMKINKYHDEEADDGDHASVGTEKSFAYRRKRACTFCMISMLIIGIVVGTLLYFYWDWVEDNVLSANSKNNNGGAATTDAPTIGNPTASPTELLLYDPPTLEQCEAIATGTFEPENEFSVPKTFEIPVDVNLEYEITDTDVMVDMLTEKLQSKLAPQLAGCSDVENTSRTLLRSRNLDATKYIIGNVKMEASHQPQAQCIVQSETCYRVLVDVMLYLHGNESTLPLVSRIGNVFEANDSSLIQKLELPSPFVDIAVHAVTATFATDSPTLSPTNKPSIEATASPTKESTLAPTKDLTAPPTIQATPSSTGSGTAPPTVGRQTMLEQALQDFGVENTNDQVMKWFVEDDAWQFQFNNNKDHVAHVMVERYALGAIFDQLGGAGWSDNSNWMTSTSHCEWHGVACDSSLSVVTALNLGGNELSGLIPTELGLLERLVSLDLDTNNLSKTLVDELANLENLEHLMLGNNQLTGELPQGLFENLVNLVTLQLDDNKFKKKIPTEVGQMSALSELSLCKCLLRFIKFLYWINREHQIHFLCFPLQLEIK